MRKALQVEIVTPECCLLKVEADELIAPGANGLFGVRPGHAPFLAVIVPGPLTIDRKHIYFVADGFAEVSATMVRVLTDAAEAQANIDVAAAYQRIAQLNSVTSAGELEAKRRIKIEQMRVEVAQLK